MDLECPEGAWIEVVLSRAPTHWRYRYRPEELRRLVHNERLLVVHIEVEEEDRADASPGSWQLSLRCRDEASATAIYDDLLRMEGSLLEVGEEIEAMTAATGDILLAKGCDEAVVRAEAQRLGKRCRLIEARQDGLAVYFLEEE